jgi:hypothetical protein
LLGGLWHANTVRADQPFGASDRSERGTYQPPRLPARTQSQTTAENQPVATRQAPPRPAADLSDYAAESAGELVPPVVTVGYQADSSETSSVLQPAEPQADETVQLHEMHGEEIHGSQIRGSHPEAWPHDNGCGCGTCDGLAACDAPGACDAMPGRYGPLGGLSGLSRWSFNDWTSVGCDTGSCDSAACDSLGCDSVGCGDCGTCYSCTRIGLLPLSAILHERWFGGAEWVLWVRRGNEFPLVAVDPTSGNAPST